MHGLVKAVLSGDCVVVMGNAAQVRFVRVRPEPRVASDRSLRSARRSPPICTHPTPPLACVYARSTIITMKTDPISPITLPIVITGRTPAGEDHHPRVARRSPHGTHARPLNFTVIKGKDTRSDF